MNLSAIILSIYVIDIIRQTIYGTYLNENFYLIKINKPHPKIDDDVSINMHSILFEHFI